MDRGFRQAVITLLFQQLAQFEDDLSQLFIVGAHRLRVPFVQRVGDGQQRLLGHLLRLPQGVRIEHHEVTRTRCPPGVDLQLQHADEVAADGLDSLEDRLLDG